MKKILLTVTYWLCCVVATLAQRGGPPAYVIRTDSARFSLDSAQIQSLPDPAGTLTFDNVQRSTGWRIERPFDPTRRSHTYWLRMRLRNERPQATELYAMTYADYVDVYWRDSLGRWQHQHTGGLVPERDQPRQPGGRDPNRTYLKLAPGQETWLYRRMHRAAWNPPITMLGADFQTVEGRKNEIYRAVWEKKGWKRFLYAGIAIGILLLAIGYNLLIFFTTRERVYLYFSLSLLAALFDRPETQHYVLSAFLANYPHLTDLLVRFTFGIFFVFFVESVRQFIGVPPGLRRLNRAVTVSLWVVVGLLLIWFVVFRVSVPWSQDLTLPLEVSVRVVYALVLWQTYRTMRLGVANARYVLIAITPLFVWWLGTLATNLLGQFGGFNAMEHLPAFTEYAESFSLAWMIIFYSAALIQRYNQTRQQVLQQAIEREQLEREREAERSRMIAEQNERLEAQVHTRTAELQQSLETLRATQNQLVQKEKLASLGELTAGIAHEIQNPLNFVNNFSEVSLELIDELAEERQKANGRDEGLEEELLTDVQQNLQKINQHGQRAGAIVRGMLEHSRASTGEKAPTDLNALADEYLRLAYHGLRAKDKGFNATLKTDFDATLPTVNVVSQDIGRVLLNLFNNAFYAVRERSKQQRDEYVPTVTLRTERSANHVVVSVSDNGTGIPDAVRAKIFQPFFTTKPTGEGTGLGLSLSYDIITKGHGGELTVDSQPGAGTTFIVRLPAG